MVSFLIFLLFNHKNVFAGKISWNGYSDRNPIQ
jgi:hypothetical protein